MSKDRAVLLSDSKISRCRLWVACLRDSKKVSVPGAQGVREGERADGVNEGGRDRSRLRV